MRVITAGTFDLFHAGHVELLRRCAALGLLTVALNRDEFIAIFKGKPPVLTYDERLSPLLACRYVDAVVPNSQRQGQPSMLPTLEEVEPDLIIVGTDWVRKDYLAQISVTVEDLERREIGLVYLPYTQGISTTEIKRRVLDRSPTVLDLHGGLAP